MLDIYKQIVKIEESRKLLFLSWLMINVVVTVIFSLLTVTFWILTKDSSDYWNWSIVSFYSTSTFMLPLGMILSILAPWGWINYLGLILSVSIKKMWPLIFSISGAVWLGIFWPKWLVTLMGI